MPQLNWTANGPDEWDATAKEATVLTPTGYIVGVDLGSLNDMTAIAVVEVSESTVTSYKPGRFEPIRTGSQVERHMVLRALHRPRLGTVYPTIVEQVIAIVHALPPLKQKPYVILDRSGLGQPVVDMARRAGLRCTGAIITAGQSGSYTGTDWTVGKSELAGTLRLAFHEKRLLIADIPGKEELWDELQNFTAKLSASGRVTYEAAGTEHDDQVIALALAAFAAVKRPAPMRVQRVGY